MRVERAGIVRDASRAGQLGQKHIGQPRERPPDGMDRLLRVAQWYSDFTGPHVALRVGVAAPQPGVPPTTTPAPPCHVAKSASVPFDGPESLMLLARIGVVMLSELNTMQTGVEQPAQLPVPTDFRLLIVNVNAKYSWPPARSWRPAGGTAVAATMRVVFGARCRMW